MTPIIGEIVGETEVLFFLFDRHHGDDTLDMQRIADTGGEVLVDVTD